VPVGSLLDLCEAAKEGQRPAKRVDDGSQMTAAKLPFAASGSWDYDFLK
jgi:hypothetical protein